MVSILFILKKWIGGLLMPLPLVLIILFIAICLLFFSRYQKSAKALLLFGFVFLFTISLMPVAEKLSRPLERLHPPLLAEKAAQNFDFILILGSGGVADQSIPITGQLSATALSRFMEALRLYNANPNATLVVSGSGFGDIKSGAELQEILAISIGIPKNKIIRLDNTLDTDDEAKLMSEIIKGHHAVLVTSATHIDRALGLFHKYGQSPVPSPANYLAPIRAGDIPLHYNIPSAYNLNKSTVAWHEYVGRLQNWVKSWF